MTDKYHNMYEQNKDFKEYVDKYCKSLRHNKTPNEAFNDITVRSYFDYIETKGESNDSPYEYQKNCGC